MLIPTRDYFACNSTQPGQHLIRLLVLSLKTAPENLPGQCDGSQILPTDQLLRLIIGSLGSIHSLTETVELHGSTPTQSSLDAKSTALARGYYSRARRTKGALLSAVTRCGCSSLKRLRRTRQFVGLLVTNPFQCEILNCIGPHRPRSNRSQAPKRPKVGIYPSRRAP
jgi:hypothetical protein